MGNKASNTAAIKSTDNDKDDVNKNEVLKINKRPKDDHSDSDPLDDDKKEELPFPCNWEKDDEEFLAKFKHKHFEINPNPAKTIDLRPFGPQNIYNQGTIGACTANAIAWAYHFDQYREHESNPFKPSRAFMYYVERIKRGEFKHNDPHYYINKKVVPVRIFVAMQTINEVGVIPETLWPYDNIDETFNKPPKSYDELSEIAKNHKGVDFATTDPEKDLIPQLKSVLAAYYPVVFGFSVYPSFFKVGKDGIVPVPDIKNEKQVGGHCVVMVGYTEKHFIVRNSFGQQRGDKGYYYFPYEFIKHKHLCWQFWTIKTVKDVDAS